MDTHDVLTVSEVAARSGFAASALRYYESQGLIVASRSGGGQRRYQHVIQLDGGLQFVMLAARQG